MQAATHQNSENNQHLQETLWQVRQSEEDFPLCEAQLYALRCCFGDRFLFSSM